MRWVQCKQTYPRPTRDRLLAGVAPADAIRKLWEGILTKLDMEQVGLHPENLLDLTMEQAEEWLERARERSDGMSVHQQMQKQSRKMLDDWFNNRLGDTITLRGFITAFDRNRHS